MAMVVMLGLAAAFHVFKTEELKVGSYTHTHKHLSTRVAYNRIGKAGSSFMISLLTQLSKKNHFNVENHVNYYPSKDALAQDLRRLPNNTIYVNHAGFLSSEGDLTWINVVREPIERRSSIHYYNVDPILRGGNAKKALASRASDAKCG